MTKLHLFLLLALFIVTCSCQDDEPKQPILVTNIVMPAQGTVFNPGDKVTISAQGFQDTDEIIFDIRWPLPNEPILNYEGYAKFVNGVITEQTVTSITFLAPGHWPASKVEVMLRRSGKMMTLGKIAVADGQSPQEPLLYGITNSYSNMGHPNSIDHIDMKIAQVTELIPLEGGLKDFSCVVNVPGSNKLCGVYTHDGQRGFASYDLTMKYWSLKDSQSVVTIGTSINGGALGVYVHGTQLYIRAFDVFFTRSNASSNESFYDLPEGMKVDALTRYPCVQVSDGYILFSADNGDGTFSPVLLGGKGRKMQAFAPIEATAMIPFWILVPIEGQPGKYKHIGGYALSKPEGTELCLWNTTTMALDRPFATFPNGARSLTTYLSSDMKTQKLYVLFDTNRGARLILSYDLLNKDWKPNPGIDYPYSEIVLAQ